MRKALFCSIITTRQRHRQACWNSGICETGKFQRWQASVQTHSGGNWSPLDYDMVRYSCEAWAHVHSEVVAQLDQEATSGLTFAMAIASSHRGKGATPVRTSVRPHQRGDMSDGS